ncbi:uncharacterized protein NECHADRAFT_76112 [Fusarium vanettenii 77-13-4]|uniref:Amidase domain-containing protein n=1 Tax=Fusarium vanettenii (strain ATCC MYA-4622 / CBS 123669 / FGSC 9596 / NRRL 45880 / 77-13-4) TaxID=660122 RepID=C7Z6I2_FUSV7|nr:uncharacterized protein NECHADRAFT_76112 [Fusarium vanettenii 77-13-4]EEU40698.1 hypothetical protein NECHADRAFT_76112 [Fusarium vanettenii 77-13-4]
MAPNKQPVLFDVLTTTADDLRKRLEAGTITSLEIVESYLSHIEAHNTTGAKCRAIISTPPRFQLVAWAARLDEERQRGDVKGPLHGIPILLKDNIATDPSLGMPTTVGSYALWDSCPAGNGPVVENLIDCGLIILGKANMTTPAGSSTGSAVGVASGFAPIFVGTETSGSMVSPAAVAALYALKLTPGSIPMTGVMELTACFDTLGAFGKSALDVALACDALLASHSGTSLASSVSSMKLEDVSVGFVDIEKWRLPAGTQVDDPKYFEQTAREYQQAKDMLRQSGVKVVDAYIIPPEEYMIGDISVDDLMDKIIRCQGKNGIERYLKALKFSKVRTLEEILQFNEDHAEVELDKGGLSGLVTESKPDDEVSEWLEECKRWAATEGIDKVTSEQGVDVVVCCSDSYFAGVSVAARYPMAAVPLGYIESSGRPYGLQAIAPAHQEAKLVRFMAAWERVFPPRRVPDLEACEKARVGLND